MSFTNNCYICKAKLVPIFYSVVNKNYLDLEKKGKIIIGGLKRKEFNSYCISCEDSFEAYTDIPK